MARKVSSIEQLLTYIQVIYPVRLSAGALVMAG
jgi:hypothetical protein